VKYRLLEHTADAMVEVHGEDLDERFENAAYAMFDQITDLSRVVPKGELKVVMSGETDGKTLEALVRGEKFDEQRHTKRSVVKGVTYHRLEFDDQGKSLTILFDV